MSTNQLLKEQMQQAQDQSAIPREELVQTIEEAELSKEVDPIKIESLWTDDPGPDSFEDLLATQRIIHVAGGALPAAENFGPMDKLMQMAESGPVNVAGVEFSQSQLKLIIAFYQWLVKQGYNLHCIDERLVYTEDSDPTISVHDGCGACAAVGATTEEDKVEDKLVAHLGFGHKQTIYAVMNDHTSIVINVDLDGSRVPMGDTRELFLTENALGFAVSLPVELIKQFIQAQAVDENQLIEALLLWNVQIARNIIGGHHNTAHELAEKTMVIVNEKGIKPHTPEAELAKKIAHAIKLLRAGDVITFS